ncbi:SAM-dependent methyltransferase [Frigidibacter sp. ROC022]|uniref:SAM-dependent methyltransferase n=1 Tax=Frigidibacter sp. ROC022 TaxID=2971796 RepID=UPI00215A8C14|nr:SAM-dependent methyltransferase [Frigidibacter sp. ROC022]MCR8723459.1 SAM-dependent methyltransferase [Frigidibacter sp. ROC022]
MSAARDPAEVLARGLQAGTPVDGFGPVWNSARLRLARATWQVSTIEPFLNYDVPYTGTSSGRLSEDAVAVALAAQKAAGRSGGLRVLEIGSGSGVFARLFLQRLGDLAPDVLARTRYLVTDGSERMLDAQRQSGVLDPFRDQIEWRRLDAAGDWRGLGPFDVVLGTYILDSLPFDFLAVNDARVWRKEVRSLHPGPADEAEELKAALASDDPAALLPFVQAGRRLVVQTRHVPIDRGDLAEAAAVPEDTGGTTLPFLHSHGALGALRRAVEALDDGGVIVVSDYGHAEMLEAHESVEFQMFGGSVAVGLNFPQISSAVGSWDGVTLLVPAQEEGALLTRVVVKGAASDDLRELVDDLHGGLRYRAMTAPVDAARKYIPARMFESSRALYARALELRPRDWSLMEEIATLQLYSSGEYQASADMAAAGLELNPLAPGLWRVRAEALLALGRKAEAREAIDRGVALAPSNHSSQRVLGEVALAEGHFAQALEAVARALASDRDQDDRESLLALQERILAAMAEDQRQVLLAQANQFRPLDRLPEG